MRSTTIMFFAAELFITPVVAHECTHTPRMSYEASHTIKLDMVAHLGGWHSLSEFELDHIVPLCMGGSNDRDNLQLQIWSDAHRKDVDEAALCQMVRQGVVTCDEAWQTMQDWEQTR